MLQHCGSKTPRCRLLQGSGVGVHPLRLASALGRSLLGVELMACCSQCNLSTPAAGTHAALCPCRPATPASPDVDWTSITSPRKTKAHRWRWGQEKHTKELDTTRARHAQEKEALRAQNQAAVDDMSAKLQQAGSQHSKALEESQAALRDAQVAAHTTKMSSVCAFLVQPQAWYISLRPGDCLHQYG